MHRTDNATSATEMPTPQAVGPHPDGFFRAKNLLLGQDATTVDADYLNAIQEEICNVILAAGVTLSKTDQSQLLDAIQILIDNSVNAISPTVLKSISQASHGFIKGQILRYNGSSWVKAIGTSIDTSWALGMVYEVQSTTVFKILMLGWIDGLTGLTSGVTYYLSVTVAGAMQSTQPSGDDTHVIVPLFVADSATSGYFINNGPAIGGGGGGSTGALLIANNLSDLNSVSDARDNLGLGTAALSDDSDFAAAIHTHIIANVTGLQDALDGKQAVGSYQPLDATLTAFAALNIQAGKLAYGSGADAFSLADLSAFVITLLDDADAATFRASLGLGTAATQASGAFAAASHTHAESDVTNLTTDLAAKAPKLVATEVTGTSQTMVANNKYIANNAGMVTLTMPTTMAQDDVIKILGKGAGLFSVAVTSGQIINFGADACTVSTGTFVATQRYSCLTIECITANTTFVVSNSQGIFTKT